MSDKAGNNKTTDDVIEEYVDGGFSQQEAQYLAEQYIINEGYRDYSNKQDGLFEYAATLGHYAQEDENAENTKTYKPINTNDPKVRKRVIKALITKREKRLSKEAKKIGKKYGIGAPFEGTKYILEYDDDLIYIPKSDYCFLRIIEKLSGIEIDKKNFNPFGDTLHKLRGAVNELIDKKKINMVLPDIMKAVYKTELVDSEEVIKYSFVKMDKKAECTNEKIFLLNMDDGEYHSILIKKNNKLNKKLYDHIIDKLDYGVNLELSDDQVKLKLPKPKEPINRVIVYDIETSSKIIKKEITKKIDGKLIKEMIEYRDQVPEGVAYSLINFNKESIEWSRKQIGEDCYMNFIDDVCKTVNFNDILIYAHNGGCFDNVYAKGEHNLKFLDQIKKGRIKKLTAKHIKYPDKKLTFLDSWSFLQASLKDACKYFKTETNKIEFDIVNKDHNFFVTNKEWIKYMEYDVISLSECLLKFEKSIRCLGQSITTSVCGISSIAWKYMCQNCYGMNKIFRPKDPTTCQFIADAIYGGRMILNKKTFDCHTDKSKGLICLDGNSLHPSSMFLGLYPSSKFILIPKVPLETFIRKYVYEFLSIVEVTLDYGNTRYPLNPYRTDTGCVIYPNGVYTGVYCSVDIQEAINDGAKVIDYKQGVYWAKKVRLFGDNILDLYDKRQKLRSEGNPMEYVYKILLNSSYGYLSQITTDGSTFSDELNPKIKGNLSKSILLKNGQYEHTYRLKRPIIDKPVHIAVFILAYSRKIMNNYIRNIGMDNIWYGDTDSLYAKVESLSKVVLSDGLGGVKNDYGDRVVKRAMFLDIKRYYLEFDKPDKNGNMFKAKFNGINFKYDKWLQNWYSDKNYKDVYSIYKWFLDNPKKQSKYDIVQERWSRTVDSVLINKSEMKFQVNPENRYDWIGDVSYPKKLKNEKIIKYEKDILVDTMGKITIFEKADTYRYDLNNYGLYHSKPMTYNNLSDDVITINTIKNKNKYKKIKNIDFETSFIKSSGDDIVYRKYDGKYYRYEDGIMYEEAYITDIGEHEKVIFLKKSSNGNESTKTDVQKILGELEKILYK